MSKATIGMCMSTTGFGSVSSLGTQPVETPGGNWASDTSLAGQSPIDVFSPRSDAGQSATFAGAKIQADSSRRMLPKFDMNLNSLFSDDELTQKPLAPMMQATLSSPTASSQSIHAPQLRTQRSSTTSYEMSNTAQHAPLATSINAAQPEMQFDKLDFLDSLMIENPSQPLWMDGFELDLGFGTGGTAGQEVDPSGHWQSSTDESKAHNGGVDLFDGFFFGS